VDESEPGFGGERFGVVGDEDSVMHFGSGESHEFHGTEPGNDEAIPCDVVEMVGKVTGDTVKGDVDVIVGVW
jgi:hypothetical protein